MFFFKRGEYVNRRNRGYFPQKVLEARITASKLQFLYSIRIVEKWEKNDVLTEYNHLIRQLMQNLRFVHV